MRRAFTLIELLAVIAIIALLIAILAPSLSQARRHAQATKCLAQLHVLGQGIVMYTQDNGDVLLPGRLPRVDNCTWQMQITGGTKYRPSFIAVLASNIGVAPFNQPMECRTLTDNFGEKGDRQDYADRLLVCPATPTWTDERNGSYGYNYQFLGNSRLTDPNDAYSFKNWPVSITRIIDAAATVAVADSMGTAASFPYDQRADYGNNDSDANRFGNEGFNLDPPRVDPVKGEMAGFDDSPQHRSAADPRHLDKASVLYVDGHADARTLPALGYVIQPDGVVTLDGNNALWSGSNRDVAWTPGYQP